MSFCSSGELRSCAPVVLLLSKWSVQSGSLPVKAQSFWFADRFGPKPGVQNCTYLIYLYLTVPT